MSDLKMENNRSDDPELIRSSRKVPTKAQKQEQEQAEAELSLLLGLMFKVTLKPEFVKPKEYFSNDKYIDVPETKFRRQFLGMLIAIDNDGTLLLSNTKELIIKLNSNDDIDKDFEIINERFINTLSIPWNTIEKACAEEDKFHRFQKSGKSTSVEAAIDQIDIVETK